jgi:prohibitin 2
MWSKLSSFSLQSIQKNPGFLSLRRIEAARNIASTVASSSNKVFLDANQLLLNVDEYQPNK